MSVRTGPEVRERDAAAADRLEAALAGLVSAHEVLLDATRAHREALSRADRAALARCVERETEILQRIAGHEESRRLALAELGVPGAMLERVATAVPEERRERVRALGERLRGLLGTLGREARVVRTASAALLRHMDGMVQQVARALDATGVYGRQGRVSATPIRSGLDVVM